MKTIVVASTNPVKINTTLDGFKRMFPEEKFEIQGVSVPSNVAEQPFSDKETLLGASNRAENAKKAIPNADYWVGIEGGIEDKNNEMTSFAWIVIKSKNKTGKSRTGVFVLSQKVADLIRQGKELGEADDIVFGMKNSKQQNGAVGILTRDVLTRTTFYETSIILALIPFLNSELY